MQEFFTTTLGVIISLGAILTVAVTGLLYIVGIFKKGKDGEDDRLINILKGTVDELEKKVNQQTLDIEKLTRELHKFKEENDRYIQIFQGRDEETKKFYDRAYAAMDKASETHDIMTTVATSIAATNNSMNRLIDLLSKSVDVVKQVTK